MKINALLRYSLVMGTLLFLYACGGGGGGASAPETLIKGVAQAGIFSGATVRIFGYDASGNQVQLATSPATVTTDSTGNYSANIGTYTGAIVVKVHGTFQDEASGASITVSETNPLQAAVANASGVVTVPVTVLTDIAVRKAVEAGGIKNYITNANQAVSNLFGFDIIATTPVAPTPAALGTAGVTSDQKKYTTTLATLSQYVVNLSSTPAAPTAADLETALTQISNGITLSGSTSQVSSPQVALNLQQSAAALANNSNTQAVVAAAGSAGTDTLSSLGTLGNTTGNRLLAVKLKTQGSYSGTIGALTASLTLPDGATLRVNSGTGTFVDSVVASGKAAGNFIESSLKSGVLTLGIISANNFAVGEFATLYFDVPANSTLTAASFNPVTNVQSVDSNLADITGLTMTAF